mmetsp:Transcript_21552/g.50241  ORF Transcript_21552/g.50241 Transcript_21552/m.50241 type:complete len:294 (-) Transcript_21552:3750-4631(-)
MYMELLHGVMEDAIAASYRSAPPKLSAAGADRGGGGISAGGPPPHDNGAPAGGGGGGGSGISAMLEYMELERGNFSGGKLGASGVAAPPCRGGELRSKLVDCPRGGNGMPPARISCIPFAGLGGIPGCCMAPGGCAHAGSCLEDTGAGAAPTPGGVGYEAVGVGAGGAAGVGAAGRRGAGVAGAGQPRGLAPDTRPNRNITGRAASKAAASAMVKTGWPLISKRSMPSLTAPPEALSVLPPGETLVTFKPPRVRSDNPKLRGPASILTTTSPFGDVACDGSGCTAGGAGLCGV